MWTCTLQEIKSGLVLTLSGTAYKLKILLNSYSRIILLFFYLLKRVFDLKQPLFLQGCDSFRPSRGNSGIIIAHNWND